MPKLNATFGAPSCGIMRPGIAYEFLENDSGGGVPNGLLRVQKNKVNIGWRRSKNLFPQFSGRYLKYT
jgi:hypothetical protein